jgi:hypothetical protein
MSRRGCGGRAFLAVLGAAGIAAAISLGTTMPRAGVPDAVTLSYKRIPLSSANLRESTVGELTYRGGLEITSPDRRFGGWSGLLVSADGTHMLSQSDEGHWLRANLIYDKDDNLVGLQNGQLADLQDTDGSKLASKQEADAEGLAALTDRGLDGPVAVSFERDARIWRYDVRSSLDVAAKNISSPEDIKTLDFNSGLEGLTRLPSGALFAVGETPRTRGQDHPAWIIPIASGPASPHFEDLSVVHHDPYEISDAAVSPDGKWLYLLERHYFGPIRGVVAAVRRIDAASVKAGARLDGTDIAQFTMHENIDNMEGLALRRDPQGRTLLYMISDDNYNLLLQRTVLLMFEVEK